MAKAAARHILVPTEEACLELKKEMFSVPLSPGQSREKPLKEFLLN